MASTWLLKQQLISEYHTLIEQLESKYANQIAALLKQKKEIILRMQQQFDQQMERINKFSESMNVSCSPSNINQRLNSRVNILQQNNTYNEGSVNEINGVSTISSLEHAQNGIDKNKECDNKTNISPLMRQKKNRRKLKLLIRKKKKVTKENNDNIPNIPSLEHEPNKIDDILKSLMRQKTNKKEKKRRNDIIVIIKIALNHMSIKVL